MYYSHSTCGQRMGSLQVQVREEARRGRRRRRQGARVVARAMVTPRATAPPFLSQVPDG